MQARTLFDGRLDSTFEGVGDAEAAGGLAAKQAGFDEVDQDRICLAIREAMVNAVAHGNRFDRVKKVHLVIREAPNGGLAIEIADEGAGFDASSIPDPREAAHIGRASGRGLLIIRAFMDEVAIRRGSPSGTHVHMVKYPESKMVDAVDSLSRVESHLH